MCVAYLDRFVTKCGAEQIMLVMCEGGTSSIRFCKLPMCVLHVNCVMHMLSINVLIRIKMLSSC